jgi:hypothetical protein
MMEATDMTVSPEKSPISIDAVPPMDPLSDTAEPVNETAEAPGTEPRQLMTFGARLKECKTATVVTIYICSNSEQISIHAYEMRSSKLHQCMVAPDAFGVSNIEDVELLPGDKVKCMVIQRLHIADDASSNKRVLAMRPVISASNPSLQTIAMDSPQKEQGQVKTVKPAAPMVPVASNPPLITPVPLGEKNTFEVKAKKAINTARTKAHTFLSRIGNKKGADKDQENRYAAKRTALKGAALKRWDSMSKILWGDENAPMNLSSNSKPSFDRVNNFIWGESRSQ